MNKVQIRNLCVWIISIFIFSTVTVEAKFDKKIYEVQECLIELGYDPGVVDGFWGKATEGAIRQFQNKNGLQETGELNQKTISMIKEVCPPSKQTSYFTYELYGLKLGSKFKVSDYQLVHKTAIYKDFDIYTYTLPGKAFTSIIDNPFNTSILVDILGDTICGIRVVKHNNRQFAKEMDNLINELLSNPELKMISSTPSLKHYTFEYGDLGVTLTGLNNILPPSNGIYLVEKYREFQKRRKMALKEGKKN